MTQRSTRVIGFLVAGAALVALADVAPQAAVGVAAVLLVGVALKNADQIQQLASAYGAATGVQQ